MVGPIFYITDGIFVSPDVIVGTKGNISKEKLKYYLAFCSLIRTFVARLINNDFHDEETYCSCSVDAAVAPDGNDGLEPESISDGPAEG